MALDKTEHLFYNLKNGGKSNEFERDFKINVCK